MSLCENAVVITAVVKICWWILKSLGGSLRRNKNSFLSIQLLISKWKKVTLCWKSADTGLCKWSRLMSAVIRQISFHDIVLIRTYHFCIILEKNAWPQSNYEKISGSTKWRDNWQNNSQILFRSVMIMKNNAKLSSFQRLEDTKETWWLNAMWDS